MDNFQSNEYGKGFMRKYIKFFFNFWPFTTNSSLYIYIFLKCPYNEWDIYICLIFFFNKFLFPTVMLTWTTQIHDLGPEGNLKIQLCRPSSSPSPAFQSRVTIKQGSQSSAPIWITNAIISFFQLGLFVELISRLIPSIRFSVSGTIWFYCKCLWLNFFSHNY